MTEQLKSEDVVISPELLNKLKATGETGFQVEAPFKYTPKLYRGIKREELFAQADEEKNERRAKELREQAEKCFKKGEFPKKLWPVFMLKSKDGVERAHAEDDAGEYEYDTNKETAKMHLKSGSQRITTLESGIEWVKGFFLESGLRVDFDKKTQQMRIYGTKDGQAVENKHGNATVKTFLKLTKADTQMELQNAVNERSTMTPEECQGLAY